MPSAISSTTSTTGTTKISNRSITDCAFCQAITGATPVDLVYSDALVVVFLSMAPLNPGHALVVPRQHSAGIGSLTPAVHGHLLQVAAQVGAAMMRATDCDGFNLLLANGSCAGQDVCHVCMQVIPRGLDDGLILPVRTRDYASPAQKQRILMQARERLQR